MSCCVWLFWRYLPPYTSFLPTRNCDEGDSKNCREKEKETKSLLECLVFSQLSYLAIFIIVICITERHKMKQDPLNFNVLSITIEVIRWVHMLSFNPFFNFAGVSTSFSRLSFIVCSSSSCWKSFLETDTPFSESGYYIKTFKWIEIFWRLKHLLIAIF